MTANSAYKLSQILELLRVKKPILFPASLWQDLEKKANENYVTLRKKESIQDYQDAYKKLQETKPDEINQSAWDELISFWKGQYAEYLRRELIRNEKALGFAQNADLSVLDESDKFWWEMLVSQIQRANKDSENYSQLLELVNEVLKGSLREPQPENIDYWEWTRIKDIGERLQSSDAVGEKAQAVSDLLHNLIEGQPIGETKPPPVDNSEWRAIKEYEDLLVKLRDVENLQKQSQSEAREISAEKAKIAGLKEKAERQLRFIHELLNDPTAIDRVEEPDDTFAEGNWVNLQKVARLLNKPKRSTRQ